MAQKEEDNWEIYLDESGQTVYKNTQTDEIQYEAPYEMKLKPWKNADPIIWRERRELSIQRATVTPRPRCFFDVNFDTSVGGRVVFELYADKAPLTSFNFLNLCTNSFPNIGKQPLKYQGSLIYSVIPSLGVFGGDITHGIGDGGYSVYGAPFDDENNDELIDREGLLVSLNDGPNLNLSRFMITLNACPQFTGIYTVFGQVIKGMSVLRAMCSYVQNSTSGIPDIPICIARCGELAAGPKPADFTLPVMPTQRDNPLVLVAPKAITGRHTVVGYKKQLEARKQAVISESMSMNATQIPDYDTSNEDATKRTDETEDTSKKTKINESKDTVVPSTVTTNDIAPTTTEYTYDQWMEYYKQCGYDPYTGQYYNPTGSVSTTNDPTTMTSYASYYNYQYPNTAADTTSNPYVMEATFNAKTGSFIAPGNTTYFQNKNLPDDFDTRLLNNYMNPNNLAINKDKDVKQKKVLPAGYKSWKEFNSDKKKQKKDKQIGNILGDKYQYDE